MPKFLWKVLGVGVILLLLFLGVVYVGSLLPPVGTPPGSSGINPSQPTYNATAGAEFTPDGRQDDVTTYNATAIPVTNHSVTLTDLEGMRNDLSQKDIPLTSDDLTGSSITLMGASWFCYDIAPLPNSVFGAAEDFEGRWEMNTSLSDLTFDFAQGSLAPEVCTPDANGRDTNCVAQYYGKLTVTISDFYIDGPVVLVGNQVPFRIGNDRAMAIYRAILTLDTLLTGNDRVETFVFQAMGIVQDQVKLETIAPYASNEKLLQLYRDFVTSYTEPTGSDGVVHTYDSLVRIFTAEAQAHGFAGIESITLIMPTASADIYGWKDQAGDPLIPLDYPTRYADSKCPSATPSEADMQLLFPQNPTP